MFVENDVILKSTLQYSVKRLISGNDSTFYKSIFRKNGKR